MTELQKLYNHARIQLGLQRGQAVRHIAHATGIDSASVTRALARADRDTANHNRKAAA